MLINLKGGKNIGPLELGTAEGFLFSLQRSNCGNAAAEA